MSKLRLEFVKIGRWVQAPASTGDLTSANKVDGVWLEPGEDVVWTWEYDARGSRVTGYRIVRAYEPRR